MGLGVGAWRSLVARLLWEQEVGGSNPSAPTTAALEEGPWVDLARLPPRDSVRAWIEPRVKPSVAASDRGFASIPPRSLWRNRLRT